MVYFYICSRIGVPSSRGVPRGWSVRIGNGVRVPNGPAAVNPSYAGKEATGYSGISVWEGACGDESEDLPVRSLPGCSARTELVAVEELGR